MRESVIYQSIKAEGWEEGSDKKARQIAFNLLKQGMAIDAIARLTYLPVEVVQQLQQEESENQG